jgi:hypothetical protein
MEMQIPMLRAKLMETHLYSQKDWPILKHWDWHWDWH